MTSEKRSRGRPRGSGKNDAPYLTQVAELLLRDQSLKPTTAMKHIIAGRIDWGASDETLLRRWQVKWKQSSQSLMIAARERAQPRPATSTGRISVWDIAVTPALQAYANSPMLKAMRDYANCPAVKAMQDCANNPAVKAMQDCAKNPAVKAMQDYPTARR